MKTTFSDGFIERTARELRRGDKCKALVDIAQRLLDAGNSKGAKYIKEFSAMDAKNYEGTVSQNLINDMNNELHNTFKNADEITCMLNTRREV